MRLIPIYKCTKCGATSRREDWHGPGTPAIECHWCSEIYFPDGLQPIAHLWIVHGEPCLASQGTR